jgi:hypothetical protein
MKWLDFLEKNKLVKADIYLKPIKDFYFTRLTKENFESLKIKWRESKAKNY